MDSIREKRRIAGAKGGSKPKPKKKQIEPKEKQNQSKEEAKEKQTESNCLANEKQLESNCEAIKGKESKGKEIKESKEKSLKDETSFTPTIIPEVVENKKSDKKVYPEWCLELAQWFYKSLSENRKKKVTEKDGEKWQEAFEKCVRLDGYTPEQVMKITQWARQNEFWSSNFQSPLKLRKKNKDGVLYINYFEENMSKKGGQTKLERQKTTTFNAAKRMGLID